MTSLSEREWYRRGWLEAVRTIDQLLTDARKSGDLEGLDKGIIERCYKFGDGELQDWANDLTLPDDPPQMDL